MDRDAIKQLISAYADGEAGPEDIARAVDAIKSDREYRTFQRDIRKLKREFKRLHNPAAFAAFKKAWRERIGIRKESDTGWHIPVNAVALTAAAVVIFIGGYFLLTQQSNVNMMEKTAGTADSAVLEDGAPEMVMQEMMPEADMASEEEAAESAAVEAEASFAARGADGIYTLPLFMKDDFISDLDTTGADYSLLTEGDSVTLTIEADTKYTDAVTGILEAYGLYVDPVEWEERALTIIFE